MKKVNEGVIKTKESCIGCNRCISVCPVKKANVALSSEGKIKAKANKDRCIDCGACVKACHVGARYFADDMEKMAELIDNGEHFSVLIDPAFFLLHNAKASQIIGYLRAVGADKVYNGGMGTEMSIWAHVEYVKGHVNDSNRAFITSHCASTINYIRKYRPDFLNMVIPVMSPMMCAAKYVRQYRKDNNKIILITPCAAVTQEAETFPGIIDYVVAIDSLISYIGERDISQYNGESDIYVGAMGAMSSIEGGFKRILNLFVVDDRISINRNVINNDFFRKIGKLVQDDRTRPYIADLTSCASGCISGSAGKNVPLDTLNINSQLIDIYNAVRSVELSDSDVEVRYGRFIEYMMANFGKLDVNDFYAEYGCDYKQPYQIPESIYAEIFKEMHKEEIWKQHIDCGSCGYGSCYEMAKCIAYGYNHKENCIHYMNDELTKRYYTDALTKLPNKEGFKVKIKRLYAENPDVDYVIGAISINQLNMMNDMYGFMVGDELIKRASFVCNNFAKDGNGIAARLGAGEFIICFENSQEMADKICNAQTYTFEDEYVSQPISYRAGLYVDHDRGTDVDTMINYASLARDRIDEDGVSTCMFYNAELRERLNDEAMVTSTMYDAIKNREFVAYFQPKFSHTSKEIVGAEVLCRWIKPNGSIISPGLFIPMFEKNGFIKILDKYMWDLTFRTILEWERLGIDIVPVSVNISRVSLGQPDFVNIIKELSSRYNIDKSKLQFEVTESAYSEKIEDITEKIEAIRSMGYKVAMDDFGSGYSSLTALKDMPIDILKLDMGFFRGGNEVKAKTIVSNVVSMVSTLELEVIAEGVETMQQAEFLKDIGCDVIQGFLYSRPVPQNEYETMLSEK